MLRSADHKRAPTPTLVVSETDTVSLHDDYRLRGQVDDRCIELFDRWCERRALTPLIYLLHAWPFFPTTSRAVERVSKSLHELLAYHPDALDDSDRQLIGDIDALRL
jgi:hypothetical protein